MIPYIMENQKNVWNHQPAFFWGESTSILRSYSRDFEGKSGWDIQVFQVHPLLSMAIPGSDWLEVPTIYKAYIRPKSQGISPQNMALYGTTYLHFRILEFSLILRPRWILLFILAGRWARATPRSAGFQLFGLFGVCLRALTGEKTITFFGGLGGDMLRWSMMKCWLFNDLVFFKRTFEFHEFPSTFIGLK